MRDRFDVFIIIKIRERIIIVLLNKKVLSIFFQEMKF